MPTSKKSWYDQIESGVRRFRTWCVVCRRKIPRKRHRRHAITCSDVHQKRLARLRKMERDRRQCSHCGKPMSQEQIAEFRLWRAAKRQSRAPARQIAAKGIRGAAQGIHALAEIAHICPEVRISKKRNR
jgi:hypothetical protein